MAKITNLSTSSVLFKSRNGVGYTIATGEVLTVPDSEVLYDSVDSGIQKGWLSVTNDAGSALFDSFGKLLGATPVPVSLDSTDVTITGPVTVASEVEVTNDNGNPLPISSTQLPTSLGAKTSALSLSVTTASDTVFPVAATARVCLGAARVTVPTSAATLQSLMIGAAFPVGTVAVELQADGGTVRIRRDGSAPTTTLGYRLDDGMVLTVDSSPAGIQVIASTATPMNVACFDRV